MPNEKIQYRLYPENDDAERIAQENLQSWRDVGYGDRAIHTEALIVLGKADGTKELPKRGSLDKVMTALKRLERKVDDGQAQLYEMIIHALQNMDLSQYVREDGVSLESELGAQIPDDVFSTMFKNVHGKTFED